MLRVLPLILFALVSGCASAPVPPAPVGPPAVEPVEPLDPSIKPLSQEEEEAAQ